MPSNQELTAKRGPGGHKIRYAVVGLGFFGQSAVLPAFDNARKNCELTALVSGDPDKLRKLGRKYRVEHLCSYADFDELLHSGLIDAVYIALPNSMHAEYTIRAARAGVHVLCEKPMAVTQDECLQMIQACEENDVRLMIAYRLHFEKANLQAIEHIRSGKLGDIRLFESTFCMQVKDGNIRVQADKGGGSVYDIGIYCINAARYLLGDEPYEVFAWSARRDEPRFAEVDEMTSVIMRFPGERLASFTSSFGAADLSTYRVVGTLGDLRVEPAYDYAGPLTHHLTIKGRTKQKTFAARDQVAAELIYFANCVLTGQEPEPSGWEGLADVRIIEAVYESAHTGKPVRVFGVDRNRRPDLSQEIRRPRLRQPQLVHAEEPTIGD